MEVLMTKGEKKTSLEASDPTILFLDICSTQLKEEILIVYTGKSK